jgi:hypothetical protein
MPLTIQCPSCKRRLNVPDKFLGKRVKCPGCGEALEAAEAGETEVQPEKPKKTVPPPRESVAPAPKRPARRSDPPDDEAEPEYLDEPEEKPRRRRPRRDEEDEDEDERAPRRRRRRGDDDEDDEYPTVRRRRRAPHRGGLVLTLGIITLVAWCCPLAGFIVGGIAMNMAKKDLEEMSAGRMDESGRTLTMTGNVCAIIGVVLSMLNFIAGIILKVTNRI